MDLGQGVANQLKFAAQGRHVLLFEVVFDGLGHNQTQNQQHDCRCCRKEQGQAEGQGLAAGSRANYSHSCSSST